ncbi:MAG: YfiR family protein [Fimbriimonas sp.]
MHIRNLKRNGFRALTLLTLSVAAAGASPVAGGASAEEAVKAAFVFNFAKLTTWPASESSGPLVIGIIGSGGTGEAIERVVNGKTANGRTINVKSVAAGAAKSCHIVFVCGSGGPPSVGSDPVLTVGESGGFTGQGGAIGLVSDGGKVKIELNKKAVKKAGLNVDSKLEAIAKVVG